MKLIKIQLEDKALNVWFNPWEYEEENPKAFSFALLLRIYYEAFIAKEDKKDEQKKKAFEKHLVKFASTLNIAMSKLLLNQEKNLSALKKESDITIERKIKKEWEIWEKNRFDAKKELEAMVENIISSKSDIKRIIIYIDDLDRCIPKTTVRILEQIKNYFSNLKNIVFIIGINKEVTNDYIKAVHNLDKDYEMDYIEKIIPYEYRMPGISEEQLKKYISTFLYSNTLLLSILDIDIWLTRKILTIFKNNLRTIKSFLNELNIYLAINDPNEIIKKQEWKNYFGKYTALIEKEENKNLKIESITKFLILYLILKKTYPQYSKENISNSKELTSILEKENKKLESIVGKNIHFQNEEIKYIPTIPNNY